MTHAATDVAPKTRKRVVNVVLKTNTQNDVVAGLRSLGATDIQVVESLASHHWTYRVRLTSPVGSHGNTTAGVETDEYPSREDAVYEAAYRVLYFKRMIPPTGPFADLADDLALLETFYTYSEKSADLNILDAARRVVERLRETGEVVAELKRTLDNHPTPTLGTSAAKVVRTVYRSDK